jgi:uncharacterized protein DUF4387
MGDEAPTVGDIAELVRSKNAGPFWITFDIFLRSDQDYQRVSGPGVISPGVIGSAYDVDPTTVMIYRIPSLRVVKISFPRPVPQGSFYDRDMHSGQHHIPLSALAVPPDPTEP